MPGRLWLRDGRASTGSHSHTVFPATAVLGSLKADGDASRNRTGNAGAAIRHDMLRDEETS